MGTHNSPEDCCVPHYSEALASAEVGGGSQPDDVPNDSEALASAEVGGGSQPDDVPNDSEALASAEVGGGSQPDDVPNDSEALASAEVTRSTPLQRKGELRLSFFFALSPGSCLAAAPGTDARACQLSTGTAPPGAGFTPRCPQ